MIIVTVKLHKCTCICTYMYNQYITIYIESKSPQAIYM